MKSMKITALALGLALASAKANALVDVNAFGGYTTLNMSDVNSVLDKNAAATSGAKATDINSGFYVGGNVGITTLPFLKIGPRIEYVQGGQGKVDWGTGSVSTVDTSLVSYEAGAAVDFSLPMSGLSVMGGLWGGYGMASGKVAATPGTFSNTGAGSGFVANAAAELRYKLVAGLGIGLDLGYRMANITNMNITASNFAGSIGKPLIMKSGSTDAANFDYSGLNVGGTISWNF